MHEFDLNPDLSAGGAVIERLPDSVVRTSEHMALPKSSGRRGFKRLKKAGFRLIRRALGTASRPSSHCEHVWAIGICSGTGPLRMSPRSGARNPVITGASITDVDAAFAADPFMLRVQETWYLFFELWNNSAKKGEIGLAISQDGIRWRYQCRALVEPFHLSYPYVFECKGSYFMVPESRQARQVRLYRAVEFPVNWTLEHVLIDEPDLVDASLFRFEKHWWMFAENSLSQHNNLRLFHADELAGPWLEHPESPVISGDSHIARPAGRVVVENGRILRFAQDCHPFYGLSVNAFNITELSRTTYREKPALHRPVLKASGRGWNRCGMHHLDAQPIGDGTWLACVDGWYDRNDPDFAD